MNSRCEQARALLWPCLPPCSPRKVSKAPKNTQKSPSSDQTATPVVRLSARLTWGIPRPSQPRARAPSHSSWQPHGGCQGRFLGHAGAFLPRGEQLPAFGALAGHRSHPERSVLRPPDRACAKIKDKGAMGYTEYIYVFNRVHKINNSVHSTHHVTD